jgi:hypothetical protein
MKLKLEQSSSIKRVGEVLVVESERERVGERKS